MCTHTAQYLSCSDYLRECSQLVDYNWQGNKRVIAELDMNSCEILMVASGDWCMHAVSICMVK